MSRMKTFRLQEALLSIVEETSLVGWLIDLFARSAFAPQHVSFLFGQRTTSASLVFENS